MGCDIHLYCEYRKRNEDQAHWQPFGARINPGRWYAIFENLAGVRGDPKNAIVQPRGMPDDAAWHASSDNRLYISDEGGEGYVSSKDAARWVAQKSSKYIDLEGKHTWVTHPDWHTHSWLTLPEFKAALKRQSDVEWDALVAALDVFEQRGFETRVVFWFDN